MASKYGVSWCLPNGRWNPEYSTAIRRARGILPRQYLSKYGVPRTFPDGKLNPEYWRRYEAARRKDPERIRRRLEKDKIRKRKPRYKAKMNAWYKTRSRTHRKELSANVRNWRRANPEKWARLRNKRDRGLGMETVLGKPVLGMDAHHFTKDAVVYIPHGLHKSVGHSIWNGRGMQEINRKAIGYYNGLGRQDIVGRMNDILGVAERQMRRAVTPIQAGSTPAAQTITSL